MTYDIVLTHQKFLREMLEFYLLYLLLVDVRNISKKAKIISLGTLSLCNCHIETVVG